MTLIASTSARSQSTTDLKRQANARVGTGRSPVGDAVKARTSDSVTVVVEQVEALANAKAKTGMIRQAATPGVVKIQVTPSTTANDLAHALLTITNSPGTTVRMRAPEMRAYFAGAGAAAGKADKEQLERATGLLQRVRQKNGKPVQLGIRLAVVSSER